MERVAKVALMLESDGPGGAERMLLQLATELHRRGHEVVPVGPAHGEGWHGREFVRAGFQPETFDLRCPVDPACLSHLVRVLRARKVSVIHSHEFTMAVYGAATARRLGVPHVITMHGGMSFADRLRRRVAFRWACRNSRATVAVSRAGAEALERRLGLPGGTFRVVSNGIRPEEASGADLKAELGISPEAPLVLAVGNLYPVKGHATLVRALALVGGDAHLAIAGRGEERGRLVALSAELGISSRLHLLGLRTDVANLLKAADVFVMPSLSEGLPLALLEAMYAAKAIIATTVGGMSEVLTDRQTALLVSAGDVSGLAGALRTILADCSMRRALGEAARHRAMSCFGVEAMAEAYLDLYGPAPARVTRLG